MKKNLFILLSVLLFQGTLKAEITKIVPFPLENENHERLSLSYDDLNCLNENDDLLIWDKENQRFVIWNIRTPNNFSHVIYDASNGIDFRKMDRSNRMIGMIGSSNCPLTWTRQNGLQILQIKNDITKFQSMDVSLDDINSSGQIIGNCRTSHNVYSDKRESLVVLCEERKCVDLKLDEKLQAMGYYDVDYLQAFAINDLGVVLFYAHAKHASSPWWGSRFDFLYDRETIIPIPKLDNIFKKDSLFSLALNNQNEVLFYFDADKVKDNRGGTYVWQKENGFSFVSSSRAKAFNDRGQVLTSEYLIGIKKQKKINLTDLLDEHQLKINYNFLREPFLMNNNFLVFMADQVDYQSDRYPSSPQLPYYFKYDVKIVLVIVDLEELFNQ